MKRRFSKIIKFLKSDAKNFLHFFLAFTGLFLVLTAIILNVTRAGMYQSTDKNITDSIKQPHLLVIQGSHKLNSDNVGAPDSSNDTNNNSQSGRPLINPGNYIILFDKNGKVLNSGADTLASTFPNLKMNMDFLENIGMTTLEGRSYRTMLIKVSDHDKVAEYYYNYSVSNLTTTVTATEVDYIQVFQNVDQIQGSVASTNQIVIITMIIFWFLSLFISIYLSQLMMRPIVDALDKQKSFVSNASHELRTPLAILQNRLELVFQNPMDTIIDQSENISASLNEVRNMKLLTSNLLDMAKQDRQLKVSLETVEKSFFLEIFDNYKMLAADAGKSFTGSVKLDKAVKVDPDLTRQLLTIFFDNALKYTGSDGVVHIEITRNLQNLVMSISDNGVGIPAKDKKQIFDRFYRVDEARTRGKTGLGLGLSLAHQIVEQMKGKITVADNKPQGTVFTIRIKSWMFLLVC